MPSQQFDNVSAALESLQKLDPASLIRREELGSVFAFDTAVEPMQKLKDFFKQINRDNLKEIPEPSLDLIMNQLNNVAGTFQAIKNFNPTVVNAEENRKNLILELSYKYTECFNALNPLISYMLVKSDSTAPKEITSLISETKTKVDSFLSEVDLIIETMTKHKADMETIAIATRKTAANAGITQEAIYFKQEADEHKELSAKWRANTIWTAVGLIACAISSLFVYKSDWIKPMGTEEHIQFAISKFLIFGTIAYGLVLCARNFLSHKHNEIVNRHRQNALLTFDALVKAAGGSEDKRDIILTHAAACIFAPQETGYTKSSSTNDASPMKIIEVAQKAAPHSN